MASRPHHLIPDGLLPRHHISRWRNSYRNTYKRNEHHRHRKNPHGPCHGRFSDLDTWSIPQEKILGLVRVSNPAGPGCYDLRLFCYYSKITLISELMKKRDHPEGSWRDVTSYSWLKLSTNFPSLFQFWNVLCPSCLVRGVSKAPTRSTLVLDPSGCHGFRDFVWWTNLMYQTTCRTCVPMISRPFLLFCTICSYIRKIHLLYSSFFMVTTLV